MCNSTNICLSFIQCVLLGQGKVENGEVTFDVKELPEEPIEKVEITLDDITGNPSVSGLVVEACVVSGGYNIYCTCNPPTIIVGNMCSQRYMYVAQKLST